ncbi:type I restriction modification DNA specificity domain protein [Peptoniphilus harei]|uniref:Type I restriction modification DNA specificity domain protein n=1 Tax=Peptoniphilus harei TaxID=54005 RepID=A0A133PRH7_9FIRM|nr:restriction endonuclease subunit S [Peptoniphilus harei]KXA31405.1 type I restriction modification DNA specificity domain protein [Peptoniphilus harei]
MIKIDELLKNEKVEWKKLGDLFNIRTGYTPSKSKKDYWKNGTVNWFTIEDIRQKGNILYCANKKISKNAVKKSTFKSNSIVLSTIATVGEHALILNDFVINQQFIVFTLKENFENKINMQYINYYFYRVGEYCRKHKRIGNIPTVDSELILNLHIPIPSFQAQNKIVETLDKFTNYVSELKLELEARNKQYEYYRDMLLSEEYLKKLSENPEILGGGYRLNSTTLGDIGKFTRGNGLQKKDFISKGKPVIHYGQIYTKFNFETDQTISFVNDDVFSKLKKAKSNDILIATTSENIEDVGKCVVWLGNEEIGFSGDMYSYCTKENPKYIAYYFQTNKFQKQKEQKVTGTKLIRIHGDDMAKFSITLPPRVIQNKVVEVLDKFQDLLSDTQGLLPEEIEQRQKQYEYYREKLLTFEDNSDSTPHAARRKITLKSYFATLKQACDVVGVCFTGVEWKKLGDIGTFENGTGMPKSLFKKNGSVGAIHYGHIYTKYNLFVDKPIVQVSEDDIERLKKVNFGDLVIAKTSENVDDVMKTVAYLGDKVAVTGGHAAIFRHDQNPKYLSYVFNGADYLLKQKNKFARGVKVIELSTVEMEKIKIPLPSLIVQNYVVSILDKFDKLVNDINEGLPKEIDLRQKQYEYYRERLLNFPK